MVCPKPSRGLSPAAAGEGAQSTAKRPDKRIAIALGPQKMRDVQTHRSTYRTPALLTFVLAIGGFSTAASAQNFASVGIYQSYGQLQTWASSFAAANPDVVRVVEYGRSFQDRPLLALQLTVAPGQADGAKPEFLYGASQHAREVISSESMYRFADKLVADYRAGVPAAVNALSTRELWILPNMNPDGRVRVEGGTSSQRKNMQLYAGQSSSSTNRGVDVNRNFPYRWADGDDLVTSETYSGPSVLSTPEAAAAWAFASNPLRFGNLLGAVDFHSGTNLVIRPWSSTSDPALPPADATILNRIANGVSSASGNPVGYVGYDTTGTFSDSLYADLHAYALAIEVYGNNGAVNTFSLFNPTTAIVRDTVVNQVYAAGTYLLSDAAFTIRRPGDFDNDGDLDALDIDQLLFTPSGTATPTTKLYDVTGDGQLLSVPNLAMSDADAWVRILKHSEYGDVDLNGAINFADLLVIAQNYDLTSGAGWALGSFNGDGAVNFADLLLLAQNYQGAGFESDWALARSLVPEPVLISALLPVLSCGRRRRPR